MGDTRNGNQKENIEELIDYLISEHRDEFEIELSEKLRGFEAQLRGEFNRRLELIRKDLSETLKTRIEHINRNSQVIDTTPADARPSVRCDYLTYKESTAGLVITGLNEKDSDKADIYIPSTINGKKVVEVGADAFSKNSAIEKVVIEDGIEKVGDRAFYGCARLKEVVFPDSVTKLGREAMYTCKNLERVRMSKKLTALEYGILYQTAIKSIELPEGLREIGTLALCGCYNLRQVNIPKTVTTIKMYAFHYCFNKKDAVGEIYIPNSVEKMEAKIFDGCVNLTINCEAKRKPAGWDSAWNPIKRPVNWGVK